jgi:hypothetical protein
MNAIQHTPGPWAAPSDHSYGDIGIVADSRLLAMVTNDEDQPIADSEQMANARLMAAAPELLAAISTLVGIAETDCMDDKSNVWRSAMIAADAAIAKAEGRA